MEQKIKLQIRGEQHYEGLAPDCTEQELFGTMEETLTGWRLCYEERGESGVPTKTTVDAAKERVTITRRGEVRSELVFERGRKHTSSYALPFGAVPVAVEAQEVRWKLGARGGLLELRYRIDIGGQRGMCVLKLRAQAAE